MEAVWGASKTCSVPASEPATASKARTAAADHLQGRGDQRSGDDQVLAVAHHDQP